MYVSVEPYAASLTISHHATVIEVCKSEPYAGALTIACAASNLRLTLSFKTNCAVEGQITKQPGNKRSVLADITGLWSDQVHVRCPAHHPNHPDLEGETQIACPACC